MTLEPNNPLSYRSMLPNPRPTSVTVLAIIGIIIGAYGVLCDLGGLMVYFVPMGPPNPVLDRIKGSTPMLVWVIFASLAGWALSILLLCASIGGLRLRGWACSGMLLYAVCKLILLMIGVIGFFVLTLPMMRPLLSSTDPAARMGAISGLVTGPVSLVLGFVYPIFVLVFLRKPHVVEAFAHTTPQTP